MLQAGIATDVGSALAPRPAPKSTATWKVFAIDSGCLLSSLLRELRGEVLENVWQAASKQLQTGNGGKPRMDTNGPLMDANLRTENSPRIRTTADYADAMDRQALRGAQVASLFFSAACRKALTRTQSPLVHARVAGKLPTAGSPRRIRPVADWQPIRLRSGRDSALPELPRFAPTGQRR
jgi:hypothetical protein